MNNNDQQNQKIQNKKTTETPEPMKEAVILRNAYHNVADIWASSNNPSEMISALSSLEKELATLEIIILDKRIQENLAKHSKNIATLLQVIIQSYTNEDSPHDGDIFELLKNIERVYDTIERSIPSAERQKHINDQLEQARKLEHRLATLNNKDVEQQEQIHKQYVTLFRTIQSLKTAQAALFWDIQQT